MIAADIEYSVVHRPRKTVEIAVLPDGSVVVAAPLELSEEKIESLVQKRRAWILRKKTFFVESGPHCGPRRYVPGETQLFLGKRYRLKLQNGKPGVAISGGYIVVTTRERSPEATARLMDTWSRRQARSHFCAILDEAWRSSGHPDEGRPRLCVKALVRRWGSLSENRMLTLNLSLIQAPKACIEYVIVHELCHIEHPGHGPDFYAALEEAMPDWRARKRRLESPNRE